MQERSELRTISETATALLFEISVWNCKAELVCYTEDSNGKREYFEIQADDDVRDQLDELVYDSVYKAGGAINISGLYPLSKELERFLWSGIAEGKIKIVPKRI